MKLLEVTSIEELEPKHVTQLERLVPRSSAAPVAKATARR
jgi:L-lactate dehydrogenase (cytochrome)